MKKLDYPLTPTFGAVWNIGQARKLTSWIRELFNYFAAQPKTRLIQFDFSAPATPTKMLDVKAKPFGVEVLAFESVATNGDVASAQMANPLAWSYSSPTLTIPSLTGHTPAGQYRLTLRITEAQ